MTRPFTRRQFGSKAPSRKSARASLRSLLRDCRIEKLASFTPDSEEWRSIVRSNSTPDAEADAMLAEVQAERLETRRAMLAAAKAQRGVA